MTRLLELFLPSPEVGLAAGAGGLALGGLSALLVARARRAGVATADTRKLFHFLVFSGALVAQLVWGSGGTAAYGAAVALLVLAAVGRGEGDPLFEALARPSDRPRRGLFVVVPLCATAAGGVLANLWVGDFAFVGYLVTGWGDAAAEPVGVRWGRHPYRVPTLAGVPAERSLEGSAAVLVVGGVAAWLGLGLLGIGGLEAAGAAAICGIVAVVVEAVSHHGLDNLTLQVTASAAAAAVVAA